MGSTSLLMFVHDPLEAVIRLLLNVSQGSLLFNLWSTPPIDIFLKVYPFNITNPKEFLSGKEKMHVKEIGPYVYREILTNRNATFNDNDGTVTFTPHREFALVQEQSIGDPKVDKMTTINLPLIGFQAYLSNFSFLTNFGFSSFTRMLGAEEIINVTIDDYLWGYKDPIVTYANVFLPGWIDFERIGIFERLMHRDNANRVTMVTDPSKYHSRTERLLTEEEKLSSFHIVKWNGLAGLKDWGFEDLHGDQIKKCHLVEGSFDGTIFPRKLRQNRSLTLYREAFCRPVELQFVQQSIGKLGFRQYEYKLADNMFEPSEENQCYCYKNRCKKGFQNIAPCYYGMPLSLSQPHFLNTYPEIQNSIGGLNPKDKEHGSQATIQPDLGIPLSGSLRIQINLEVGQTKGNHKTIKFNGLQVPLFWVEISAGELPFFVVLLGDIFLNVLPVVFLVLKYLFGVGGSALIVGTAFCVLFKTKVSGVGYSNSDYRSIPIINIPSEIMHKYDRRVSLK